MFPLRQLNRMHFYWLDLPFHTISVLKVTTALFCFKNCYADTFRHGTLQPHLLVAFSVQVQLFFFLPLLFCPVWSCGAAPRLIAVCCNFLSGPKEETQLSTSQGTKPIFQEKHPGILMLCEPSFNTNGQSIIKLLIVLGGHCKESQRNRSIKVNGRFAKALT